MWFEGVSRACWWMGSAFVCRHCCWMEAGGRSPGPPDQGREWRGLGLCPGTGTAERDTPRSGVWGGGWEPHWWAGRAMGWGSRRAGGPAPTAVSLLSEARVRGAQGSRQRPDH